MHRDEPAPRTPSSSDGTVLPRRPRRLRHRLPPGGAVPRRRGRCGAAAPTSAATTVLYRQVLPPRRSDDLTFAGYNSSFFSPLNAEMAAVWIAAQPRRDA